jgi:hypothetical protein
MKEFLVYWTGTCQGSCIIEAANEKDARTIAEFGEGGGWDGNVEIDEYPDDWKIEEIEEQGVMTG